MLGLSIIRLLIIGLPIIGLSIIASPYLLIARQSVPVSLRAVEYSSENIAPFSAYLIYIIISRHFNV